MLAPLTPPPAPTGTRTSRTLGLAAAVAIAVPAAGSAVLTHYEERVAIALSRKAELPCTLGAVEAGLLGEVRLRELTIGRLFFAERIEVAMSLASLVGGPLSLEEVVVAAPRLAISVDVDGTSDLSRALGRLAARPRPPAVDGAQKVTARRLPVPRRIVVREGELDVSVAGIGALRVRDVELWPRPGGVRAIAGGLRLSAGWTLPCPRGAACARADLSLELSRGAVDLDLPSMRAKRALVVGGAGQLAIGERRLPILAASAGRLAPGAPLTAKLIVDDRGASRELELHARSRPLPALALRGEALPLWPLADLAAPHIDLEEASFSGELAVARGATVSAAVTGALRGAVVHHAVVSPRPVPVDAELDLVASLAAERATTEVSLAGSWSMGALALAGTAEVHKGATLAATLDLALSKAPCQALLDSLPDAIAQPLEGLALRGELGARLRVAVDTAAPLGEGSEIAIERDGSCRATAEPAWADVTSLVGAGERALPDGTRRAVGPGAQGWVELRSLPAFVDGAFVAAEDARFFDHDGFDVAQIARSLEIDLREGRLARGGSTISQQLVKNELLDGRRNASRKLVEAILTWRLEERLDKRQILERYLNIIELGPRVWGLGAAAQHWFGTSPQRLTVRQAAFLAALTPEPTTMSRRVGAARGLDRASAARVDTVLRAMKRANVIDAEQYDAARDAELHLRDAALRAAP